MTSNQNLVTSDGLNEPDTRNVLDKYRNQSVEAIVADLDTSRSELEVAVENLTRDFNMGTIVRNANAFNVARVHVIGRRQWNRRGAMKTDAYLHIVYHETVQAFLQTMQNENREVIAVDIVPGAKELHAVPLPERSVLVFGSEGDGLSQDLLQGAKSVAMIEQFGSTRSINVGVASGIAMYAWVQQHRLLASTSEA